MSLDLILKPNSMPNTTATSPGQMMSQHTLLIDKSVHGHSSTYRACGGGQGKQSNCLVGDGLGSEEGQKSDSKFTTNFFFTP